MFTWRTKIRLYDTDESGRLYFASLFRLAHDALDEFLLARGTSIRRFLDPGDCSLPIVHAESDYLRELRQGDEVDVRVTVEKVGTTSFGFCFRMFRGPEAVAVARTVHVATDPSTATKRPIPSDLRQLLAREMTEDAAPAQPSS